MKCTLVQQCQKCCVMLYIIVARLAVLRSTRRIPEVSIEASENQDYVRCSCNLT